MLPLFWQKEQKFTEVDVTHFLLVERVIVLDLDWRTLTFTSIYGCLPSTDNRQQHQRNCTMHPTPLVIY